MFIYKIISIILYPLVALYIFIRAFMGKENFSRISERFGYATIARPEGELIWIHAVSVGETNSAMILVDEILKNTKAKILFTTTTLTSAAILQEKIEKKYKGKIVHQFLPIDCAPAVEAFLRYWKPRIALFLESEVWPNFVLIARKNFAISSILINARMSEKSSNRWFLARKIGFKIFDYFAFIFAQTKEDQKRFAKLTNQEILFYGNLKSQAASLSFDEEELARMKKQIGRRKIFLAASTHKTEEENVIAVHKKLKEKYKNLLTILVVRHPNRADEITTLMKDVNFSQRSKNQEIIKETEIYFVDTLGELGLFYKLTNFAFIGGSLADVGGHNPYEAIKLDCAVISGDKTFNFKGIYEKLTRENSCQIVRNEIELCAAVDNCLSDSNFCKTQSKNAKKSIANSDETAQKIVKKLQDFLLEI